MQKLKVKFWRVKNIVLMQVEEQDNSTRGLGILNSRGEILIRSHKRSHIERTAIYVRGIEKTFDDRITYLECQDSEDAKRVIESHVRAIREYNESIANSCSETVSDDVEFTVGQ